MKKLFLLLLCCCGFLQAEPIKCVSHRGEEFAAPEASRPAFELAMKLSADIIKLDVRSTKDGVLALSHDETLKRTMNWDVKVAEKTFAELKEQGTFLEVGGCKNEKLLTLAEALEIVKTAPEFWLDPKDKSEKTIDDAVKMMLDAGIRPQQIMIAAFSNTVLEYARKKYPDIRRVKHLVIRKNASGKYKGMYSGNFKPNLYKDSAAITRALSAEQKRLGLYGVNIPLKAFFDGIYHAEAMQKLRENKLWCALYFVHDSATAEYAGKLKSDAFVTGAVEKVRSYCK